jgi:hypothetical protein
MLIMRPYLLHIPHTHCVERVQFLNVCQVHRVNTGFYVIKFVLILS